jgi:hypothetical protein
VGVVSFTAVTATGVAIENGEEGSENILRYITACAACGRRQQYDAATAT